MALAILACSLGACTTVNSVNQAGEVYSQPGVEAEPDVPVSQTQAIDGGDLIYYDPLAPNWTIKERPLSPEMYHLSLRAKNFRIGGDGESIRILKRRALQLQREKGFSSYRVLDYSEGVESSTPFAYRVSEGTIELVKNQ